MNTKISGTHGEVYALQYLLSINYKFLERNYRCNFGEIDLIMADKNCIVFVEVKYRKTKKFGEPAQAVTKEKQHTIKKVARHYLKSKEIEDIDCRFDVVQIVDEELTHYKNAF